MKKIMFVCTGNICRSVMAERILSGLMNGMKDIQVLSAGTRTMPHYRIEGDLIETMRDLGVKVEDHRGVQVTPLLLKEADVVVAMEEKHREYLGKLYPPCRDRIFLIKEFGGDGTDLQDPVYQEDPDFAELEKEIRGYLRVMMGQLGLTQ